MRKAAAYIRVSTDDQLEYSPDSQLRQIQRYAQQHQFILPENYLFIEEEGCSGRASGSRPEFLRMIACARTKPKPFDAILVWKYSRFARNRQDSIVYKSMLRKDLGIEVLSVSESLGDDKMSIITEAIIEAMDEFYSVNLAEEVTRGMSEKAARGQAVTYAPLGYRMEEGRYLPDDADAPLVRMMYQRFLQGSSCWEIAQELNAMGARTRFGNPFASRSIEYILSNPVYAGNIRWTPGRQADRTILSEGEHQPLVSRQDWEAVQEERKRRKERYRPGEKSAVKPEREFALRGLVRCSSCGATLTIRHAAKGGASLQCNRYTRGACHDSHSIRLDKMNGWVLRSLEEDFGQSAFRLPAPKSGMMPETAELLQARIHREESRLVRLREAYQAGVDSLEEYRREKQRTEHTLNRLHKELETEQSEQEKPKQQLAGRQELLSFLRSEQVSEVQKNQVLRSLIAEIRFDRKANTIEIVYSLWEPNGSPGKKRTG